MVYVAIISLSRLHYELSEFVAPWNIAIVRFEQTIFEIYHSNKSKVAATEIQMTTKESTKSHSETWIDTKQVTVADVEE